MHLDGVLRVLAIESDHVLLDDGNGACRSEEIRCSLLAFDAKFVCKDCTAGEDGKITENRLVVVTEAGSLQQ